MDKRAFILVMFAAIFISVIKNFFSAWFSVLLFFSSNQLYAGKKENVKIFFSLFIFIIILAASLYLAKKENFKHGIKNFFIMMAGVLILSLIPGFGFSEVMAKSYAWGGNMLRTRFMNRISNCITVNSIQDNGLDEDNDGLYESMVFEITLDIRRAGNYEIEAGIGTTWAPQKAFQEGEFNDKALRVADRVNLKKGRETIKIKFPAKVFLEAKQEGNVKLSDFKIFIPQNITPFYFSVNQKISIIPAVQENSAENFEEYYNGSYYVSKHNYSWESFDESLN